MLSTGVLLALDMSLISVLFIFLKKRPGRNGMPAVPRKTPEAPEILSMNKKESITETPRSYPEVSDLERLERSLVEKERKLDDMTKRIEERLKEIDRLYEEELNVYSLAMRMAKNGHSSCDITRELGLLNGEAEVIESICNFSISS